MTNTMAGQAATVNVLRSCNAKFTSAESRVRSTTLRKQGFSSALH